MKTSKNISEKTPHNLSIVMASHLSDAQHLMERGNHKEANMRLNFVKWLITKNIEEKFFDANVAFENFRKEFIDR